MSDPNQAKPQPPLVSGNIFANIPQLVYLLYLLGFVIHPAALVGLVLAFVNRDGASPLERSHYDFQISTFWRGLIMVVVGIVAAFVVVGWLILLFWVVWTIMRCIKGLTNLSRGLPMAADIGWKFG
jgi:uncharacterized membrane protein